MLKPFLTKISLLSTSLKKTEARIAIIEKENEELHRLGKPLKHVPQYVSQAQLTPEVLAKAEADVKAELKDLR